MLIGGFEKSTLIDYPGKIAATVFVCGCDFRCPFCHNPELVDPERIKRQPKIEEEDFFRFLKSRRGLLDGVCVTGGEPTGQPDLIDFVRKIKKQGFLVKLDTNGSRPEVLKELFQKKLLDFVAMDIKNIKEKYSQTVGAEAKIEKIERSIALIRNSDRDYEFRTTVVPDLIDCQEIEGIGQWLSGARIFVLQQFRANKALDPFYQKIRGYTGQEMEELAKIARPYFGRVEIRGLELS